MISSSAIGQVSVLRTAPALVVWSFSGSGCTRTLDIVPWTEGFWSLAGPRSSSEAQLRLCLAFIYKKYF